MTYRDAPSEPHAPRDRSAGDAYRFTRLRLGLVMHDMRFRPDDPAPGDHVPAFDLPTLGGGRFRSADLASTGPTLLVFGSSTCPVTDSAAPGLIHLHERFGHLVRFVMVDVREAHPGATLPQPATLSEKRVHADHLRTVHGIPFDVAIDDLDGQTHRAFGPKPNSAYLIGRDGRIAFRAHWANDIPALETALEAITAGRQPSPDRAGGTAIATWRMLPFVARVLDRAGRGAWRDMWLVAPPIAAIAMVLKAVRRSANGQVIPVAPAARP